MGLCEASDPYGSHLTLNLTLIGRPRILTAAIAAAHEVEQTGGDADDQAAAAAAAARDSGASIREVASIAGKITIDTGGNVAEAAAAAVKAADEPYSGVCCLPLMNPANFMNTGW